MRQPLAYCLFETALGWCGIAWRESSTSQTSAGITLFQLPEATPAITEDKILRDGANHRAAPPPEISGVIDKICRHLNGEPQNFQDVELEMEAGSEFALKVYSLARTIPAGHTMTYGEIADALHRPGAARAVGQALGRNPIALLIPCHRVLAAGGKPGGFSAPGGLETKAKLLALEGVRLRSMKNSDR